MLNLNIQPKPITVELKDFPFVVGYDDADEPIKENYDFEFECGTIPTSLAIRLGGGDVEFNLLDYITLEGVADRISGWSSEVLRDKDSGAMLECTRENILQFMDEIPEGYTLLTTALTMGYYERIRKNSKGSSVTTGTGAGNSAGPAKRTTKRPRKKKVA